MQRLLFVCTSNMTRSPTCEDILKGSNLYETKSAGTGPQAIVSVSQKLIDWADEIVVMCERTDKHLTYLKEHFNLGDKKVIDLDLPDFIYTKRGEPALVKELKERLAPYFTLTVPYDDFLRTLTMCPFCDRQNRILEENAHAYLTYALAPYHRHHLLVIPKRHIESIDEIAPDERVEIERLQTLGLSALKKLQYESITLLVREGRGDAKSVAHMHFHLIPKIQIGDLNHYGEQRVILSPQEVDEVVKEIGKVL